MPVQNVDKSVKNVVSLERYSERDTIFWTLGVSIFQKTCPPLRQVVSGCQGRDKLRKTCTRNDLALKHGNMALFTRENAAEMGRLSAERRRQRSLALAAPPLETDDSRRKDRVLRQIDRLDVMIEHCRDAELFLRLANAKERLWNLVYPKPGSLRPGKSRSAPEARAPIQPLPAPPTPRPVVDPAPVVSDPAPENHNSENVQS